MGKASNLKEIFSGVPQGARWSPGLWNFDIHDLPDHVLHGELFSYADDCCWMVTAMVICSCMSQLLPGSIC